MSINHYAIEAVTSRATTDREFRQRLLADPNSAISEVLGRTVPPEFKVQVFEQSAGYDTAIVLPELMDAEAELSAEELESVAGGVAAAQWCDKVCISQGTNITFVES